MFKDHVRRERALAVIERERALAVIERERALAVTERERAEIERAIASKAGGHEALHAQAAFVHDRVAALHDQAAALHSRFATLWPGSGLTPETTRGSRPDDSELVPVSAQPVLP